MSTAPLRNVVLVAAITLAASLALPLSASAGTILWDDSHDSNGDELTGNFSNLATLINGAGHTLVEFDGSPGAITPAALAGYDALWLWDAELALTPAEITAIQDFVTAGGGLFVAYDIGTDIPSHHALLAPFGVTFNEDNIGASGLVFTHFAPHPVTMGLTSIGFDYGSSLTVAPPSMELVIAPDPVVLCAATTARVVVFGDTATFGNPGSDTDLGQLDNAQLALNIADWTTTGGPISTDETSWGAMKALYR